jgi:hypothetical protein
MKQNNRGFLVLEILIAGLILTSSIAASMYLFRMGFQYLEKANDLNVFTAKLPDAVNLLKTVDLNQRNNTTPIGDDVTLIWESQLLEKMRPLLRLEEGVGLSPYEHYLYKVRFKLVYKTNEREYEVCLFRYKRLVPVSETVP